MKRHLAFLLIIIPPALIALLSIAASTECDPTLFTCAVCTFATYGQAKQCCQTLHDAYQVCSCEEAEICQNQKNIFYDYSGGRWHLCVGSSCDAGAWCDNSKCGSADKCPGWYECGTYDAGFGVTLDCGNCEEQHGPGWYCDNHICERKETTCADYPGKCGWLAWECNESGFCQEKWCSCSSGETCIKSDPADSAGTCIANPCESYPGKCGYLDGIFQCINGGCTGLHCNCPNSQCCNIPSGKIEGTCKTPQTCGGLGWECGDGYENACNNYLDCGQCPAGQTCENHKCVTVECIPKDCCNSGWVCGTCIDNCGQQRSCGQCPAGQTCENHNCIEAPTPTPTPTPQISQKCKNNDLWQWSSELGFICGPPSCGEDCGESETGTCGEWQCSTPEGATSTQKKKTRIDFERGCSINECYETPSTQTCETFSCPNGCSTGNCWPKAKIQSNKTEITPGEPINFNASSSTDPDGVITSYNWDFGDGTTKSGATASHTYNTDGSYTVTLTVTDNKGATGTAETTINVSTNNQPPIASFTANPSQGIVPLTVQFDASASSDPDGSIVSYEWNFGDGGSGTGMTTSHTFNQTTLTSPVQFTVTLTVKDDGLPQLSGTESKTITVKNNPPNADFKMIPFPATGIIPLTIIFIDKSTDPDGHAIVSWNWDFGDMQTSSTQDTQHAYSTPGQYTVTLTVKDQYGATATKQATVNAKQRAQITYFNATDPIITPTTDITQATTIIELQCNKPVKAQIKIFTQDGKTVTDKQGNPITELQPPDLNCDETTPPIQLKGFPQPGIYKAVANITSELCENCPKTKHIIVKKPQKQASTPETTPILTALIATTILIITSKHKKHQQP